MVANGDHVRAIGWLSAGQAFPQGKVTETFVARLREFVYHANDSSRSLGFGAFGGLHDCELCLRERDARNFGVPAGPVLYVAPAMVLHYVERHAYCPPAEFIDAVVSSPLPSTPEYETLVEPFRLLHQQEWERLRQRQIDAAVRWAYEQGGTEDAIQQAAWRFMGGPGLDHYERIRRSMPRGEAEPCAAPDPAT
jgi:hypothetical protein